jgi:hypothetical protein
MTTIAPRRRTAGWITGLVGFFFIIAGMLAACALLWIIVQFIWTMFLIFLQGAGPSTGNFQDPSYGRFVE